MLEDALKKRDGLRPGKLLEFIKNQARGATAGKLAPVHKESGPKFWYPKSLWLRYF